jgi:hypothetical protein
MMNKTKKNDEFPCYAQELAERIRKQRGLPVGTIIPILYKCPCPNCSIRCIC